MIRFEINGCNYYGDSDPEKQVKKELEVRSMMYAIHKPDAIVRCFDYDTNELLDELKLSELFNDPLK